MLFASDTELKDAGFQGFLTVDELRASRFAAVPRRPGVYLVLAELGLAPAFVEVGTGGHFKGRDPNVPVSMLAASWVDGTIVLNIGKAGGARSASTLRKRIRAYLRFGAGQRIGHSGGRYIWQLRNAGQLRLCWAATDREPRDVEREMIERFKLRFGKRPFANLRD